MSYQVVHYVSQEDEDLQHQVCDQHQDCIHVDELPVPAAGLFRLAYLRLPSLAPMKVRGIKLVILQLLYTKPTRLLNKFQS